LLPKIAVNILVSLCCGVFASTMQAADVTFDHDVMAVISKAGCNLGSCHGNATGKGGLKLSLRGQDPQFDYDALARQHNSRRVDLLDPANSLMLLKPTSQVAHLGGKRFRPDSLEYEILRNWVAAGAPGPSDKASKLECLEVTPTDAIVVEPVDTLQLKVVAQFSDGTQRDVTRLATFDLAGTSVTVDLKGLVRREALGETTVIVRYLQEQVPVRIAFLPARPNFAWSNPPAANYIDEHVFAKLRSLQMNPSELCSDSVFIRRAYLDLLGILPTGDEARAFVADAAPDKRAQLVDRLLLWPEFAEQWALKWSDLLRNEEKVLDAKGVDTFYSWIRDSIATGKPLDEFVQELVAAEGSTYDNPPANFYRANRDPLTRGETAARLFLGVRLQCARCHNHPFDRWTQDDYYSWGAVFARIDYKLVDNKRKDKNDKHEFDGEQIVLIKKEGEVTNARTDRDAEPKFLGDDTHTMDPTVNRLPLLAEWLTSPENELFVKSQANFIWYQLLGRGLVEPIDDFRLTNPPSNPQLLDALARDFTRGGFDLRHLVRTIMNSRTYQLASQPNETNASDEANFARAIVRRWPAEKLIDAQCQALDVDITFNGYPQGTRAGQIRGVHRVRLRDKKPGGGDRFLATFGKPERLIACECERSNETTLKQAFVLIGDEELNEQLSRDGNRLAQLLAADLSDGEMVAELYWSILSRAPSADELAEGQKLLGSSADRFPLLQDLAWALLNAKEFIFRQ
jgi:hypothetical protein